MRSTIRTSHRRRCTRARPTATWCASTSVRSRHDRRAHRLPGRIPGDVMSRVLAGVLPVLVTPFGVNGGCGTAALSSEVDFVIGHAAHGVVLGMVSEVLRLSSEERDARTDSTCKAVDGRVSVTASVGAESLHTALRYAKH